MKESSHKPLKHELTQWGLLTSSLIIILLTITEQLDYTTLIQTETTIHQLLGLSALLFTASITIGYYWTEYDHNVEKITITVLLLIAYTSQILIMIKPVILNINMMFYVASLFLTVFLASIKVVVSIQSTIATIKTT